MSSKPWRGSNRAERLPSNWSTLRMTVLRRDSYSCQLRQLGCLGKATDVDHIQRGDNHSLENLQAVCTTCHKYKSSREGNQAKAALRAARFRKPPRHPGKLS